VGYALPSTWRGSVTAGPLILQNSDSNTTASELQAHGPWTIGIGISLFTSTEEEFAFNIGQLEHYWSDTIICWQVGTSSTFQNREHCTLSHSEKLALSAKPKKSHRLALDYRSASLLHRLTLSQEGLFQPTLPLFGQPA
jgi:hypothetical protein